MTKQIYRETIFLFSILFILLYISRYSPNAVPEVISTAGSSFNNGSNELNWTLGEPVTSTLNTTLNTLTQGFHQGNLNITSVDNFDAAYGLSIFPNPTIDIVQIQFEKANENNVIELYTAEGKLLSTQSSNYKELSQIDMSKYTSGTYLLKIQNKNTKGKSYQIIKTK